jgi:hypothetical protein
VGRAGQAEAARLEGLVQAAAGRQRALDQALREIARNQTSAEAQLAAREAFDARLPTLCRRLEVLEAAPVGGERSAGEDAPRGPRPSGPTPALWAERQVVAEHLERGGPRDPAEELRRLGHGLVRAERDLADITAWQRRLSGQLGAIGPLRLLRSEGRQETRRLQAELGRAQERAEDLQVRRGELLESLAQARAHAAAREVWQRTEAPVLARRMAALDDELARQVEERSRFVEREPPAYLERAMGSRPEHERPLARWCEAVRELEGYRLRHGISDPERALGPEPEDPARSPEHRRARAALEDARLGIERADPAYRSPFSLEGRLGSDERPELWAPQHRPAPGPRQERDSGPSMGLGL